MPRQILEDWSAIGFDPWSAGKQLRTTAMITDLSALESSKADDEEAAVAAAKVLGESVGKHACLHTHTLNCDGAFRVTASITVNRSGRGGDGSECQEDERTGAVGATVQPVSPRQILGD